MSQVYKIASRMKPTKHIVTIGHLDHGKSTLLGRIFYDRGLIDKAVIERARKYAQAFGQKKFDFAYLMDSFKEERARGITIGLGHKKLETKETSITFGDAPGHHDFLRNMLIGAAESDAAILVVAVDEGPQHQTEEHLFLAKMLGLPQVVIAINKMDLVSFKKSAFEKAKKQVLEILKKVGYFPEEVPVIPISALHGHNVTKKSAKMSWFRGPTILKAIEKLPPTKIPSDLPLRLPVQDLYPRTRSGGKAVVGRLVSGKLKEKDELVSYPSGEKLTVKKLFIQDKKVKQAIAGDNLYLYLKDHQKTARRGCLLTFPDEPPTIVQRFRAQLITFGIPKEVGVGFKAIFEMLTEETPCLIEKFIRKIDTTNGVTIEGDKLGDNESGEVIIKTQAPVFIEEQGRLPFLAKFRLRLKEKIVGMGICLEVLI